MRFLLCIFVLLANPVTGKGERSGDFDYYVLALSWSPNWCTREGHAKNSPQCDPSQSHGWVLHGLWPQYEEGWPSFCPTTKQPPSRRMTQSMIDIMGTSGLAWHQWRKHGVCDGTTAQDYFDRSRQAYAAITRPPVFRKLDRTVLLPAKIIEEAFLKSNPILDPDGVTITCKDRGIQEVRICLNKDLSPRRCGRDVIKDCALPNAWFDPIK